MENPIWTGWDVLLIAVLTLVAMLVLQLLVIWGAIWLVYPHSSLADVAQKPILLLVSQFLLYAVVAACMVMLVEGKYHVAFWQAIRWNWPKSWATYLMAGIALSFALQGIAHFLPIPKELPMDRFFRTPAEAWALSLFGVTFAPLLEELFFRGFLYPVLVRRFGIAIAVLAAASGFSLIYAVKLGWSRGVLLSIFIIGLAFVIRGFLDPVLARRFGISIAVLATSAGFSLIHAPQLGRAWGPVLVIFIVGLAFTITRAVTKSVAAPLIMHVAYNSTLSILLFAGTDGFRHLERLNQ